LIPIWASPIIPVLAVAILICAVLVLFFVFLRAIFHSTVSPDWPWVLGSYGMVRLILLPVAPLMTGTAQHVTEDIFWWWLSLAVAPLAAGVVLAFVGRLSRVM
jgi:hypothetical protein